MRTCAALITVNDPLLMDCILARYMPVLEPCHAAAGSIAGACYYGGAVPVPLREPSRGLDRPTPRLPDRVLSRQFFSSTLLGAVAFREQDTPTFRFRNWVLVTGGVLDTAGQRPDQLAIPLHISRSVRGSTSAEQILHQFVSFLQSTADVPPNQRMRGYRDALRSTLSLNEQWFPEESSRDLTVLLGDSRHVVGATLGRPLWYQRIDGIPECTDCGCGLDGQPLEHKRLRSIAVLDSQTPPGEDWTSIEQNNIFSIDRTGEIEISPLRVGAPE